MKKFVFIVLSLITFSSFSQHMVCNCNFGIKAGANFASITDASGLSNRIGFRAGFFGGARLTSSLGIQGDVLYSEQGAEIASENIELSYIIVPVVLKVFLVEGLNVQVGPQFGFILNDNVEEIFGNTVETESFDLSGVAGLGYDLGKRVRIAARYHLGITDIFKNGDGRNSVVSLSLGYSFL